MAVHVYLGDNGVGKTRLLRDIVDKYRNKCTVVSNFEGIRFLSKIDNEKLNLMESGVKPFGEYNSRRWAIYMRDSLLEFYAKIVLNTGDILVLDEIDSLLTLQQMVDICAIIRDVEVLWKDIYIAGHSPNILNASYNPITHIWCKGQDIIEVTGDSIRKHLIYL